MPERSRGIHGCFLELYRDVTGRPVRPLGGTLPEHRRRRPRRRPERAQLDRQLAEAARYRRRRMRRLSGRRTARPPRMGRHRAADRRAARPRAGAGPHGDAARIPGRPPAVRTGGARSRRCDRSASLVRSRSCAAGSATGSAAARSDDRRARLAAVSCGAALRARCVDRRTVDRAARRRSRSRVAAARRRAPASNSAPGVRTSDSISAVRRVDAAPGARPPPHQRSRRVLHRRAGGVVPPPPRRSRACLRDVRHGRVFQRGDVPPGRHRRPPAAAVPGRDSSRPLRRGNRGRWRQPDRAIAAAATTRRGVPRLQRASRQQVAGQRRRAHDGVRLAGPGAAHPARRLSLAAPRDGAASTRRPSPPAHPPASWIATTQRRRSASIPGSPYGRWPISSVVSSKTSEFATASRRSSSWSGTDRSASTIRTSRLTTVGRAAADGAGRTRARSRRWPTTRACDSCSPRRGCRSTRPPGSWAPSTTPATTRSRSSTRISSRRRADRLFERAVEAIETTRRREAHERCRRFDAVPRWYPAAGGSGARGGTRRGSGPAAARVRPCDQRVLHHRPADAHARLVSRSPRLSRLVRSDARRRWRHPRAHPGRRGARRRRHQPRVLLQLRRSDRLRLRHQAAAQRHVAARGHGRCAERSAHRASMADGRDPRAHATGDCRGELSGSPVACGARATGTSNGSCKTAGSGSPASIRSRGRCGSSGRQASSRIHPNTRWPTVVGESAAWYQGKRGFLPPVAIVPGPSIDPDDGRAGTTLGMTPSIPLTVWCCRRRIAGPPLRAARHRVTRQPATAGAMDGLARRQPRWRRRAPPRCWRFVVHGTTGTGTHLLSYGAGSANPRGRHRDRIPRRSAVARLCDALDGDRRCGVGVFESIPAPGAWLRPLLHAAGDVRHRHDAGGAGRQRHGSLHRVGTRRPQLGAARRVLPRAARGGGECVSRVLDLPHQRRRHAVGCGAAAPRRRHGQPFALVWPRCGVGGPG